MEALRSIRELTNKAVENARIQKEIGSSNEADASIVTTSDRLNHLLQQNLSPDSEPGPPTSVEFTLSDLLIVSDVTLMPVDHDEVVFVEKGEVSWEGPCEVTVSVWPARVSGKHKCPRCWRHTRTDQGELCTRCQGVENGHGY